MRRQSRRQFIGTAALGAFAAPHIGIDSFTSSEAIKGPLSFQTWGMKDRLVEDLEGTLEKIHALGYEGLEMCSPISYKQFAPFQPMGPAGLRKTFRDAGFFCHTCHFAAWELMDDNVPKTIEFAKTLGLNDVTISSAGLPNDATMDDWKAFTEKTNRAGEQLKEAGLQLAYHNHAIGPVLEGEPLYDHLMNLFDPELVKMQFQIASIKDGYDVIEYLGKYPGRYISLHMHDWAPEEKKIVPVGDGVIDWSKLIKTAKKSGIAEYGMIVEIESRPPDDPFEGLARSIEHLKKLDV